VIYVNLKINDFNGEPWNETEVNVLVYNLAELDAYIEQEFKKGARSMVAVILPHRTKKEKENAEPTPSTRIDPQFD
jgi:hypothetical protein